MNRLVSSALLLASLLCMPSLARDKAGTLPAAEGYRFHGKTLGILTPDVVVDWEGTVDSALGTGDSIAVITRFCTEAIAAALQAKSIFPKTCVLDPSRLTVKRSVPDKSRDSLTSVVDPAADSLPCNIILIISPFHIESQTRPSMKGFSRGIAMSGSYTYQNAKTGALLACGSFDDDEQGSYTVELDCWNGIVAKILPSLMLDGSFELKKK